MSLSKTFKSLHGEDVVYKYVDLYSRQDTSTLTYLPLPQEILKYLFFHNITTTRETTVQGEERWIVGAVAAE